MPFYEDVARVIKGIFELYPTFADLKGA